MSYDQTNRILAIDTDLGENRVLLTELEGEERLSQPFLFRIRFSTEASYGEVKALLGSAVTLWFGRPGDDGAGVTGIERRPLHGHIRRLQRGATARGDMMEWRAEVVPALWFLSRTSDCRIFQGKTVPDIVKEVLSLHGVTDVQMKCGGSHKPLEYCVQYRESALDFISRLMEQEGIFYWHEHERGRHTLVVGDENGATRDPGFPELPITGREASAGLRYLDEEFSVRSGKWTLQDFNFETPSTSLEASEPTTLDVQQMKTRERYDYPGPHQVRPDGRTMARWQIEREEAHFHLRRGAGGVAGLGAGVRVRIAEVEQPDVLVTEVLHHAEDYSHWSSEEWGDRTPRRPFYENEFVCIPKAVPFRPERVTPKPFVHGPQTAMVTGLAGEEIHTDKYGRVKVQFHWDRLGKRDENTTCWIRVSQGWAGQGYGQIHIPRIGNEVIVDFLEGDPDRPIVTGRVYNAESTVPYGLPDNKTQSGIKTRSSKGGNGFNEQRFEDKKGSEQIFIHAEKDYDTEVENNETRKVGLKGTGNRTTEIKNDETLTVGNNKTTTVKAKFDETVQGTETRKVFGNVDETFMANETRKVMGSVSETVMGSVTETTMGSLTQTVTGGITITTPAAMTVTAMGGWTLVAPAGTRTVDSFFDSTGGKSIDAFGFKLSISGMSTDICAGLGISMANNKVDMTGMKIDVTGTAFENTPAKIESVAQAIAQGVANLHVVGLFVVV